VFGRYLLVQRLSRGGMGEIFLAKHGLAGFEKLAVIKKVLPNLAADQQFISRFVDEAQVAIKLQHVNVAQVFEVGRVGDEYFLALEYVEGRDLRRTLTLLGQREQRMPVDLALFVGRELANGLAYAHRRSGADGVSLNLVHCDISPPNVLVSFEGETKVIDFGIAKSRLRGTATDPKMGFGKFGYMAPEQLIRGGMVDFRTDIYAAGVVLFELLTGTRLYEAGDQPDYRALARKVSRGEYPLPSEIEPSLAPYDDLVATALRPKQEDRYQSAAELRDAIQQCLVAVNPTISTDQLGSYMRELFADEMLAQRELHDRVAKAHLSDFKDQLTTQSVSTVSFALANMPLLAAPDATGAATLPPPQPPQQQRSRPTTRTPPGTPVITPPAPLSAPPQASDSEVAELGTSDLSLADGTGSVMPMDSLRPRRRWPVMAAAGAALVFGGIVISWAMSSHGGSERVPDPAAGRVAQLAPAAAGSSVVPPMPQQITVVPILDQPTAGSAITGSDTQLAAAGSGSDGRTAPHLDPGKAPDLAVAPHPEPGNHPAMIVTPSHPGGHPHGRETGHHSHETKVATAPHGRDALTRDAIAARFSATMREYAGYKAKYGMRLDGEWSDLATFVQFQLKGDNLDEAAHKIDAFRAKMHEPQ
jgi:serine/threonine protein kinase